ncbi:MAG TPA: histidine phosphatase family protein [Thermoanaerobaculia bacterium]|nr:histidine phosphatase family protein [Thermoanaerobaculia bacterium]
MTTTRVYLIRHGATELTVEDRFAGALDVLLSDIGREQARLLGERLAREKICAVYASPMKRTVTTAEIIAAPHRLPVKTVDAVREIGHGRWEGKTRWDVEAEWPNEYHRWEDDPFTFAPVGGESVLQVTARALPALLELVVQHQDLPFVVVSHKATIRLLLSSLLGFDPRLYRERLDQSPCALNIVDFKDVSHARLTLFNDVSHYEREVPGVPHGRLSPIW